MNKLLLILMALLLLTSCVEASYEMKMERCILRMVRFKPATADVLKEAERICKDIHRKSKMSD